MPKSISATLSAWATELGMESRTLARKLSQASITYSAHGKIRAKKIVIAAAGDNAVERARLLKAQADAQEHENKINDERWVQISEVEEMITNLYVLPLRQRLLAFPNEHDAKCNPHDPQLANTVLTQAIDELLKLCLEKLPEKRKEN